MGQTDDLLTRAIEKILPSRKGLADLMKKKKIRLYLGIDPTGSRLHLGHTLMLRKLQKFANLGHEAILMFGTGTVLVGDPSERDTGRKLITEEEIEENIATWKQQVSPIVDFNLVKVRYNGDWLTKMTLKDLIKVASNISAVQLLKREMFQRRIAAGDTVWYHETMYPLLQGYDSVALDVDLEIGGADQIFNMLVGRELAAKMNHKEKFVLAGKMISGTDGAPMSKTRENCIFLTDTPGDMFGKLMGVRDDLMADYFEAFTDKPMDEIKELNKKIKAGGVNPMDVKKDLAELIVDDFRGREKAREAREGFENVFQKKQEPEEVKTVEIENEGMTLMEMVSEFGPVRSRSEAKRLIEQGGVEVNGEKIEDPFTKITAGKDEGALVKMGKKDFVRFVFERGG